MPRFLKAPGGTELAIDPISTDCTSKVHIRPLPMESTGTASEDITIH